MAELWNIGSGHCDTCQVYEMSAHQAEQPHDAVAAATYYNAWDIKFEVEEEALASYGSLVPPTELSVAEDWNLGHGNVYYLEEKTYTRCSPEHSTGHFELPVEPRVHVCDICSEKYDTKTEIYEHIAKTHDQKFSKKIKSSYVQRTCEYCNKSFKYKVWHEHLRKVHNQRATRCCQKCPKTFRTDKSFFNHNCRFHNEDSTSRPKVFEDARTPDAFKCANCDKTFNCKRYLGAHNRNVHRKKELTARISDNLCSHCAKTFKTRGSLCQHIRNVHSSAGKMFACSMCPSVLRSQSYLLTHMRRVHYDDGKRHPCNICGKSFKSPRYMSVHRKNAHAVKKTISSHRVATREH